MKKFIPALALFFISVVSAAETVYTIDSVDFTFRTNQGTRSKMIVIPGGTELTLLDRNTHSGFSKVRTAGGVEGYIVSRSLAPKPGKTVDSDETSAKVTEVPEEPKLLNSASDASKKTKQQTQPPSQSLTTECDRSKQELAELKTASKQTLKLKEQRDQLQERNTYLEQQLDQIKRENKTRQTNFNREWLLYGGGLAFVGIILGILLPKLTRKRRYGDWE